MTFEWEKAWLPNIAEPEEILPDAIKNLPRVDQAADRREWGSRERQEARRALSCASQGALSFSKICLKNQRFAHLMRTLTRGGEASAEHS